MSKRSKNFEAVRSLAATAVSLSKALHVGAGEASAAAEALLKARGELIVESVMAIVDSSAILLYDST